VRIPWTTPGLRGSHQHLDCREVPVPGREWEDSKPLELTLQYKGV
jgi:hypothetical protein